MFALMSIMLFLSLFLLFLFLIIPDREYAVSPVSITFDYIRRSIENHYDGDKKSKLKILGKTISGVIKTSLVVSIGFGLLGILLSLSKLHWLALIVGIVCSVIGFLLSQVGVNNEFKKWQARVFAEVPILISFAPSFLKVGGITLRDAISMTVPFLSGPLRNEIWAVLDKIKRTGNTRDAFDELAERVRHPAMDAICMRLSTAWDASPSPNLFDDLADQMQDLEEIAAAGSTAARAGVFALICVLGLIGVLMVFGYPAWLYEMSKMAMGFS